MHGVSQPHCTRLLHLPSLSHERHLVGYTPFHQNNTSFTRADETVERHCDSYALNSPCRRYLDTTATTTRTVDEMAEASSRDSANESADSTK